MARSHRLATAFAWTEQRAHRPQSRTGAAAAPASKRQRACVWSDSSVRCLLIVRTGPDSYAARRHRLRALAITREPILGTSGLLTHGAASSALQQVRRLSVTFAQPRDGNGLALIVALRQDRRGSPWRAVGSASAEDHTQSAASRLNEHSSDHASRFCFQAKAIALPQVPPLALCMETRSLLVAGALPHDQERRCAARGSRNQARSVHGSTWSRVRDRRSILGGTCGCGGRRDGRSCASLFDPDPRWGPCCCWRRALWRRR